MLMPYSISLALVGLLPLYKEHDFTYSKSNFAFFLQAANPNLSHLVPTFEALGMFSKEDLIEDRFFQERIDREDV
jgi:hypothetical protein